MRGSGKRARNNIADAGERANAVQRHPGPTKRLVDKAADVVVRRVDRRGGDERFEVSDRVARHQQITADAKDAARIGSGSEGADCFVQRGGPRGIGAQIVGAGRRMPAGLCIGNRFDRRRVATVRVGFDDGLRNAGRIDASAADRFERALLLAGERRSLCYRERGRDCNECLEERAARRRIMRKPHPRCRAMRNADPIPSEEVCGMPLPGQRAQERANRPIDDAPRIGVQHDRGIHECELDVDRSRSHAHFGAPGAAAHEWPVVGQGAAALKCACDERFVPHDRHGQFHIRRERPIESDARLSGNDERGSLGRSADSHTRSHPHALALSFLPKMSVHREEGRFIVRVELSAEFDEDYEGDEDGYVWLDRWRARVQGRLVRAVFDELRSEPGFDAVPASRGKSPDEEIEIHVRLRPLIKSPSALPAGRGCSEMSRFVASAKDVISQRFEPTRR